MTEQNEQLVSGLREQTAAITALTESMNRLANSNAMLAQAVMQLVDDGGEEPQTTYLDGRPLG
ncbi:hypothetical protein [uncultured Microbulbifer sp.]|uniref:hypothetical protein n=1 Tax=uncultured Microbulbifer sp. TaxID=348147 RepID=UPI0025DB69DB|nr:hypothetical protein [uncultured Microbulbifer sp.]